MIEGRTAVSALRLERIEAIDRLIAIAGPWRELLSRSARDEIMLSPAWLLAWWRIFGSRDGRELRVAAIYEGDRLIGLAPLLARAHRYFGAIGMRRLEPIGSGEREADEICSEYLGVIAERGRERDVATLLARALGAGDLGRWDELVLPVMAGDTAMPGLLASALGEAKLPTTLETMSEAPYIPLPPSWEAYLAALPRERRYFVSRSLRDFDRWAEGAARVERAVDAESLARGRSVLRALHAERWHSAAREGVFASPIFSAFHDAVMPELLHAGALDLEWLTVRGEPVAAVYNVVWDRRVLFYQGGRSVSVPRGLRPGVVLHTHAIRRAIEERLVEYDFLGGAVRYKLQMALATRPLVRLRATRPSIAELARSVAQRGHELARHAPAASFLRSALARWRGGAPPSAPRAAQSEGTAADRIAQDSD